MYGPLRWSVLAEYFAYLRLYVSGNAAVDQAQCPLQKLGFSAAFTLIGHSEKQLELRHTERHHHVLYALHAHSQLRHSDISWTQPLNVLLDELYPAEQSYLTWLGVRLGSPVGRVATLQSSSNSQGFPWLFQTFQVNIYAVSTLATVEIQNEMHVIPHCNTHIPYTVTTMTTVFCAVDSHGMIHYPLFP